MAVLGCLLIPRGVELQLGTMMINPARILFLIFTIVALYQLYTGAVVLRATPADWFIAVNIGVIVISCVYHGGRGAGTGLENATGMLVDMGMAYFVARVFIRDMLCYRYFVRIALMIAAISAVSALGETFTGYSIIRAAWHMFFPQVDLVNLTEQRYGLYRAQAAFREHILFGLYCSMVFALSVLIAPQNMSLSRNFYGACLVLCVAGVLSSMSSGPWLSMALCIMCLLYAWFTRNVRGRWKLLIGLVASVFLLLNICSNRGPIVLAIDYLTLDSSTGHFRLEMWDAVIAILHDNWLLGWGWGADWPRPAWYITSSIDSFYAVWFVRSGVFAVLAILGFIFYSWFKIGALSGWRYPIAREALGWQICTICLFVSALTVDIFGTMIFAVYFMFGAGQVLVAVANRYPDMKPGIMNARVGYIDGRKRI
jgi:hypothetical protein